MTTILPLLLPLLLLLGLGSILASNHRNDCTAEVHLGHGEVETIDTSNVASKNVSVMAIPVDMYPLEGFEGVSLEVVDGNGITHDAWFAYNNPDNTCLQWSGEWRKLKARVQIILDRGLNFKVNVNKCILWCRKNGRYTSLQRLSVVGHGSSDWSIIRPGASCGATAINSRTVTSHHLPVCLKPPPPKIKTAPSLHSSCPCTAHRRAGTSSTEVVVVGWVVGVVAVVTTVVVTVVVVCQIWRQGSAPPHVTKHRPQSTQPPL